MARLPHKSYERAQLVLFAGKREQGKTTGIREYLETREPRAFIFDPFEDFRTVRLRSDWRHAIDELADGGPCRRRIVPPINSGSRDFAAEVFEACIENLRDCLLVLDEITLWSGAVEPSALRTLILQGRRLGIRMVVACQRIALVPGIILSEATEMLFFRMSRPRDLKTVAEWSSGLAALHCRDLDVGECLLVEV